MNDMGEAIGTMAAIILICTVVLIALATVGSLIGALVTAILGMAVWSELLVGGLFGLVICACIFIALCG